MFDEIHKTTFSCSASGIEVYNSGPFGVLVHRKRLYVLPWFCSNISGFATSTMESVYNVPFLLLECPHLKLKKPSWVKQPSAMTVFALVLMSYFMVTGGESNHPSVFWVL